MKPDLLLRAALWLVLIATIASTRTDPDLWGHVRFGLDILRDWSIPGRDPYSFTSDRPWVNHEWAAEVVSGVAYQAAGNAGLVLAKIAVVVGMLLLLDRSLRQQGVGEARHRDLLGAAAVITTLQQAHHVRPQIFSLICFAVLLSILASPAAGRRRLLVLPVLFAIWPNFHGGWIVGGGILALWTLASAVAGGMAGVRAALPLALAGAASLAATLLNPEGPGMHRFLYETVGFGRADITDWQPIYVMSPAIWVLWIVTLALALAGIRRARPSRMDLPRIAVVALLAFASCRVNRLLAFFALATLFLLGPAIAAGLPRRVRSGSAAPRQRRNQVAAMVVAGAVIAGALGALIFNMACIRVDARTAPEPGAVEFFKSRSAKGRLVVWFGWGQYAIWHLAPDLRVSIDGRRETVYSANMQERHLRFFFDTPGGASLPRELAADFVWIPKDLPAAKRLQEDGWVTIYTGERSAIFAPAGSAAAQPPARSASEERRCFPGP